MKVPLGKAIEPARILGEMIALLAGQYPHNSYAIPGGVVGEVTPVEMMGIQERHREIRHFFREYLIDMDMENFVQCDKIGTMLGKNGDLPVLMKRIIDNGWERLGRSHDRFIVFCGDGLFKRGKSMSTSIYQHLDTKYLTVSPVSGSEAKNVSYRGKYYETGPLARAMLIKTPLIREAHRRYGDSLFSRILARVCEIPRLLHYSLDLLEKMDISQPSWIDPGPEPMRGEGVGVVEAARGSLIHRIETEEGKIKLYEIITPTQWNLGNGTRENPGVAQLAMTGLHRSEPAELVFKSFDVCSVCTTH
jgi:hydrogenase large subunit